nr:11152_t:CDS:2 [Entrophospora candida]
MTDFAFGNINRAFVRFCHKNAPKDCPFCKEPSGKPYATSKKKNTENPLCEKKLKLALSE